ncbi:unnamed product [Ostreococcus tauri]|uniref:Unnamed product n=1 Tax=Ostreococcus tauri TaxID=70448 RepID=Q00YQ5_OSTTA|nr:unnamed product [Ostreococcus tauri]CAL55854.1 unnamed product [Ostreococcus tauri]|eukprot:XP_003082051.1 unnamed product [Ostreococcus tauri]
MASTAMASRATSSTAVRCGRRGARATGGRRGARAGKTRAGASELAAVDAVIDLLLEAKDEEELAKTVAENVLAFDQQMWMRFASRSDGAETAEEKTRLMEAAGKCMKLVEAMVERTESTIEEASSGVQQVVGAAADPASGEFDVPLKADALERMKRALETVAVDERMLNTIYAWIRKSDENGLDGMVHILQRLLQLYAARELDEKKTPLDTVIRATAEEWTMHFIDVSKDGYSETAFVKDLQRRMEGVVLNLPNGSYAQRVQAEYLKEIEDRGKEFFASQQA